MPINVSNAPSYVSLVGFSTHDRMVIASLFKVSGIYQEWQEDMQARPACVLLDVDQEEGRLRQDEEQQNPSGLPIVAVGAQALGQSATAQITRPFRWGAILETLETAIEHHKRHGPARQALSTTLLAAPLAETEDGADRSELPRVYKTVPAALIVNPNPKGWRYITGELVSRGYRVDHVSTGAAALLLLANFRYNLVFVETQLPDEDGVGICKMLKQAQGRRRVTSVILSTNRKAVDRIRSTFAGCDAFISTPVDPDELHRTLDKLVPEYVLAE